MPTSQNLMWGGMWGFRSADRKFTIVHKYLQDARGGESGIRTHGTVSRTHAFQACALSHSAISPEPLHGRARAAWQPSSAAAANRNCIEVKAGGRALHGIADLYAGAVGSARICSREPNAGS